MATIRTMANQLLEGRVGQTTFYARKGIQVARQSKNNSNYGAGASRTLPQMSRRVRWANLVNLYKVFKFWMPKAFEGAQGGVTVYNRFMSLNTNTSFVALTKTEALQGASVCEGVNLSRGSLPSIGYIQTDSNYSTDIVVSMAEITEATTVGALSTDIIENNADFTDGDNIALVSCVNTLDSNNIPHVRCMYNELTLDTTSTVLVTSLPIHDKAGLAVIAGHLGCTVGAASQNTGGLAFIHTRKVSGRLQVSSQFLNGIDFTMYSQYTSDAQIQKAIDSYGVDPNVPLDPGF